MQDGEMGAWEAWEMLTAIDDFGDNVTMLQLRDPPYTVVELWWESEGKLRFSYDDVGDDVMCVWAHGGTSNNSAWELEGLRQQLSQQRGLCPQPARMPASAKQGEPHTHTPRAQTKRADKCTNKPKYIDNVG